MHLYNYIWVVLLVSRLNLAFLSSKLSRGIDKMLVCLYPCGFNNPRNTVRWKLLQLTFVRLRIILLGLRTANSLEDARPKWSHILQRGCKARVWLRQGELWDSRHASDFRRTLSWRKPWTSTTWTQSWPRPRPLRCPSSRRTTSARWSHSPRMSPLSSLM
jgi:hypothetical protein